MVCSRVEQGRASLNVMVVWWRCHGCVPHILCWWREKTLTFVFFLWRSGISGFPVAQWPLFRWK